MIWSVGLIDVSYIQKKAIRTILKLKDLYVLRMLKIDYNINSDIPTYFTQYKNELKLNEYDLQIKSI